MTPFLRIRYPQSPYGKDLSTLKVMSEDRQNGYDNYLARLIKLIPSEAVAFYLTARNMYIDRIKPIEGEETTDICDEVPWLPWLGILVLFVVRFFGTRIPISIDDGLTIEKHQVEWPLIIISAVAFVIWVYALGDCIWPTTAIKDKNLVSIAVMLFTILIPYVYKPIKTDQ